MGFFKLPVDNSKSYPFASVCSATPTILDGFFPYQAQMITSMSGWFEHIDLWPYPISSRSSSHDIAIKLLKYVTFCRVRSTAVFTYQGSHRVWKTWKNKIFWKNHGKSWNFEKSSKFMELRKSHTDKSSPSIRNLALISFASHLVSCIHSNPSDYELLGEFEADPLVYCYWFNLNISSIYNSMILWKCTV